MAGAGREEGVVVDLVPRLERQVDRAERAHVAANDDAVFFVQPFLGDGAGADDGRGQPRRRASAAARVAEAVFLRVGVVGVAGAEGLGDVAVVLAALVFVADQQRDRRAGGLAFVHAGEDFHRIGFAALGDVARGAGLAAVEIMLDVGLGERHAGRAAVDHAADGGAVRFAENGDTEQFAECAA